MSAIGGPSRHSGQPDVRCSGGSTVPSAPTLILAASNEALRAAAQAVEAKLRSQLPDLGGLGLPGV